MKMVEKLFLIENNSTAGVRLHEMKISRCRAIDLFFKRLVVILWVHGAASIEI